MPDVKTAERRLHSVAVGWQKGRLRKFPLFGLLIR